MSSVFKPIRIFWENGVKPEKIDLAVEAAKKILRIAGVEDKMGVELAFPINLADQRKRVLTRLKRHLDADQLLDDLHCIFLGGSMPAYKLLLTETPLFSHKENGRKRFIVGYALDSSCALVCTSAPKQVYFETVLHELGHIFRTPNRWKRKKLVYKPDLRAHCRRACVMYAYTSLVRPFFRKKNPFCRLCTRDLRDYFKINKRNRVE